MARLAVMLAALGGCNAVFGLNETIAHDAHYFDAPADAPFSCPPLGTAPRFAPILQEAFTQACYQYVTTRSGRAAGSCRAGAGAAVIHDGLVDQPMSPSVGLEPGVEYEYDDQPALSQDGERMIIRRFDFNTNLATFPSYRRNLDGSWRRETITTFGPTADAIGPMASTPRGDHILVRTTDSVMHEWLDDGSGWREVGMLTTGELGVTRFDGMALTGDGLRAIVITAIPRAVWYTDRADLSQAFGPVKPLVGAPIGYDAHMTEDCARVYASGLGRVFYAQHE